MTSVWPLVNVTNAVRFVPANGSLSVASAPTFDVVNRYPAGGAKPTKYEPGTRFVNAYAPAADEVVAPITFDAAL